MTEFDRQRLLSTEVQPLSGAWMATREADRELFSRVAQLQIWAHPD